MATAADNYLKQGVQQAVAARDSMPWNMADTWKDYSVQYALAQQANQHEIDMWNMQNAYNSPSAQMSRFKEAGLNPMLAYTQGNPGNASSSPGVHVPNVKVNPTTERILQTQQILSAITNLTSEIFGVVDQGMDLQLKQDQLDESNFLIKAREHLMSRNLANPYLSEALDPTSNMFDLMSFIAANKYGFGSQHTGYTTAEASAALQGARLEYQDYYNKNLLPLIKDYQEGKISVQDLEKGLLDYQSESLSIIPAEFRGVVEMVSRLFAPWLKIILRNK